MLFYNLETIDPIVLKTVSGIIVSIEELLACYLL